MSAVFKIKSAEAPGPDRESVRWLLGHFRNERTRLQTELEQIGRASARLTTLYAAVEQLHDSLDRDTIVSSILDILINVVGAEQVAVFDLDESGACLNLVSSVGVDPEPLREVGFGEGLVGRVSASRRMYVKQNQSLHADALWEESVSACIPLKVNRRLTGAVVIFGMQAQKIEFTPADIELFGLISKHAALALYAAALHATNNSK